MITRQHAAITYTALHARGYQMEDSFRNVIPWALFFDAIRCVIPGRQAGHCETSVITKTSGWMIAPSEEELTGVTKENVNEIIDWYIPENAFPKCVIGEATDINEFDIRNFGHPYYHSLRAHLDQDIVLDDVLRDELVDCRARYTDKFTLRSDPNKVIDGAELRKQVALFERYGFIHLAGMVYERTGEVLNNKWFAKNVEAALKDVYPDFMVESTMKYMWLSEEDDARITAKKFKLTDAEIKEVYIAPDLIRTLNQMYVKAYQKTMLEF